MTFLINFIRNSIRYAPRIFAFRGMRKQFPWLPWWIPIYRESDIHPHVPAEKSEFFHSFVGGTTEFEVLNHLFSYILVLKPQLIVETGAAIGIGTIALASACRANGFGHVHSVEIDEEVANRIRRRLKVLGLSKYATVHTTDSREFLKNTQLVFDIGFFDSLCEIRAEEFAIALDRNLVRSLAVFHDTSPTRPDSIDDPPREVHEKFRHDVYELAQAPRCSGTFESTLSRGFIAVFMNSSPHHS